MIYDLYVGDTVQTTYLLSKALSSICFHNQQTYFVTFNSNFAAAQQRYNDNEICDESYRIDLQDLSAVADDEEGTGAYMLQQ